MYEEQSSKILCFFFDNTLFESPIPVFHMVKTMISRQGMQRSFSHGAVAPRPCIATGKGVGKKTEKVGFTPCGSILSFLGFVTASLCNILLEQETVQFGSDKFAILTIHSSLYKQDTQIPLNT